MIVDIIIMIKLVGVVWKIVVDNNYSGSGRWLVMVMMVDNAGGDCDSRGG